ncbi:L,D-transpeptidase [Celeribacter indicus]|uniref:Putative ErfK/YbiS/YcfS/YnhG protein n=1 Tax=Celeribacter indicus TaxID=1208324 RepID=A0A0B5DYB5_9RHOB|nr:L,D-transpeptidase [Celeribacter indicus]AJE45711.1 putative ErfK/YbiS/YcfS/YnhG protein [Celeribacter indicus]SDX31574.1 L,D-transpeptidase catalytic domain [Celeribacter indicus]
MNELPNRRRVLAFGMTAATALAAPSILRAQEVTMVAPSAANRHNTASFRAQRWQDHFQNLRKGAILCDLESRVLHYWSEDESLYLVHPSSVPMSEELTRRGYTEIVLKRRNPTWIPTPNMRERDPTLPRSIGPGPDNPLGTRALNLSWQYYRIHGIDLVEKIGRPASNGCVGIYNENIERLFDLVEIGTQVRLL